LFEESPFFDCPHMIRLPLEVSVWRTL